MKQYLSDNINGVIQLTARNNKWHLNGVMAEMARAKRVSAWRRMAICNNRRGGENLRRQSAARIYQPAQPQLNNRLMAANQLSIMSISANAMC